MTTLTLPEQIVLRQFVFGNRKLADIARGLGATLETVHDYVDRICQCLRVRTIEEAIELAVRGGDYMLDFAPDFHLDHSSAARKARREQAEQRQRIKEAVCAFVADYYRDEKEYARLVDVCKRFGMTPEDAWKYIQALNRTYWIEIIRRGGEQYFRPLAKP